MKQIFFILSLLLVLAGCSAATAENIELPVGDATRGEALFQESVNGAPACTTCHTLDGSTLVGPSLQGVGQRASSTVEGEDAESYLLNSILNPSQHLVSGFANVMYPNYRVKLDEQQTADLIAFLLTQ